MCKEDRCGRPRMREYILPATKSRWRANSTYGSPAVFQDLLAGAGALSPLKETRADSQLDFGHGETHAQQD